MNDRVKNWGFPRWGDYGLEQEAVTVRLCDYEGCQEEGKHPAPKSSFGDDRWWFCQNHAAEYNKNWNFFRGMTDEEARKQAEEEAQTARGFRNSGSSSWMGSSDNGVPSQRRRALAVLELDEDATPDEIKAGYRKLAKRYHPDTNPGDEDAAVLFQQIRAAYDLLERTAPSSKPR
ncbi:MAG: J domain-containing protein [Pseudomonadota bacterium]